MPKTKSKAKKSDNLISKQVRLMPTPEQERNLYDWAHARRWAWNKYLGYRIRHYEQTGMKLTWQKMSRFIKFFRKHPKYDWVEKVPVVVLKQAFRDLDKAFENFFDGISKFPKFKSRDKDTLRFSGRAESTYIEDGYVRLYEKSLKMGHTKTKTKAYGGKLHNVTVKFDGKYWYMSYAHAHENQVRSTNGLSIGVDVGLKTLMVLSNGDKVKNINKSKKVKKLERRRKILERRCSRKWDHHKVDTGRKNKKGQPIYRFNHTKNTDKLTKKINRIYRKLRNIRQNHIHTATKAIIDMAPSKIVIEDIKVQNMTKNKKLAKHISNAKWFEIRRQLTYKAKMYLGVDVTVADRWFASTQTCSCCGARKIKSDKLSLADRTYTCECGNVIDRDLNAAINLANYTA